MVDLFQLLSEELSLSLESFSNKVIVVTGSGRGIGLQIARAFAMLKGKVILAELSSQGLEAERSICSEGYEAHFIQTDVSDQESVANLVNDVHHKYGTIDILINNAIFIEQGSVAEMSLETWHHTLDVNLTGTFITCQAFIPEMMSKENSVIVNMVSTQAMPGLSAYIASKQGITGFSQSLASEMQESGVKVIAFAPGMVDTPGIRHIANGLAPRLGLSVDEFFRISLHSAYEGMMPAEHAAAAAVYLVKHWADEYHGQVVDGYEILERAGLIKPPKLDHIHQQNNDIGISFEDNLGKLLQVLDDTGEEFNKLPVFIRPIAKQGFRRKSGLSLQGWRDLITAILTTKTTIPSDFRAKLDSLSHYYEDVPAETARFTKDEETLAQISVIANNRISLISKIKEQIQ